MVARHFIAITSILLFFSPIVAAEQGTLLLSVADEKGRLVPSDCDVMESEDGPVVKRVRVSTSFGQTGLEPGVYYVRCFSWIMNMSGSAVVNVREAGNTYRHQITVYRASERIATRRGTIVDSSSQQLDPACQEEVTSTCKTNEVFAYYKGTVYCMPDSMLKHLPPKLDVSSDRRVRPAFDNFMRIQKRDEVTPPKPLFKVIR